MKMLITGSKGQLGTELQKQAACEVVPVDIDALDSTKLADFRALAAACRPDVIVNCAAFTNVDGCEANPDAAFSANALGARNAAIAADEIGARLIHISTDYVFGGDNPAPRREWDLPGPRSVYGLTKLKGEEYARQFCRQSFIVRTAWLYGLAGNNFVKAILGAARQGKPLKVVDDQRGNPTNAADLAGCLIKLAGTEEYGTYHCTNNGECSWYEFARAFLELSGLPHKIEPCATEDFPRPAKRPAYSSLDNMMLRLTVGDGMRPWQDAIKEYMGMLAF
jgi:dTDP-4-dehydrorhamnose reductase